MTSDDKHRLKLFCPVCGQKLSFSGDDLRRSYRCPRCQTKHLLSDIIPPQHTVDAITAHELGQHPSSAAEVPPERQAPVPEVGEQPPAAQPPAPETGEEANVWTYHEAPQEPQPSPRAPTGSGSTTSPLHSVVRLAIRLDGGLQGKRRWVAFGFGLVVLLISIVSAVKDTSGWSVAEVFSGGLFLTVLVTLAFVHMLSYFDEELRWQFEPIDRIRSVLYEAKESTRDLFKGSRAERYRIAGSVLVFLGVFAFAWHPIANVLAELGRRVGLLADELGTVYYCCCVAPGVFGIPVGAFLLALRQRELRHLARSRGMGRGSFDPTKTLTSASSLPAVVDCVRDPEGVKQLATNSNDAVLAVVLAVLASWRPGRRLGSEKLYQRNLVRHLVREAPETDPKLEAVITGDGRYQRADILVAGVAVLEMKKHLRNATEEDRAIGQLIGYIDTWSKKGPIILIICETTRTWTDSKIVREVTRMHSEGRPVLVVAAGREVRNLQA